MVTEQLAGLWIITSNIKLRFIMTIEKDPKNIRDELAKKNVDQSEKKLAFDPTTGELIIKSEYDSVQKPGEVVVDQIYKDGFFSCL